MGNKQFSLRSGFVAVTLFACVLGLNVYIFRQGQRSGFSRGYRSAMNQRLSEDGLVTIEYSISAQDMANMFPNEPLYIAAVKFAKQITENAKPETWDHVGGYGTLNIEGNGRKGIKLIASNSIPAHLEVSRIVDDLRGAAFGIRDRSFVQKPYESSVEDTAILNDSAE